MASFILTRIATSIATRSSTPRPRPIFQDRVPLPLRVNAKSFSPATCYYTKQPQNIRDAASSNMRGVRLAPSNHQRKHVNKYCCSQRTTPPTSVSIILGPQEHRHAANTCGSSYIQPKQPNLQLLLPASLVLLLSCAYHVVPGSLAERGCTPASAPS